MELTPELLTDEIDFRVAVRGYDRNEVDDFLERVAVAVGQLQDQLAKAVERARKAESSLASGSGEQAAGAVSAEDKPKLDAVAPASIEEQKVADPAADDSETEQLNEELRRALIMAQRTADAAVREAEEMADRIRDEARSQAQAKIDEADADSRRSREEARAELVAEIGELEAVRESLRGDAGLLERYLGDERARVRETIQVLRRLVNDPESFEVAVPPELSDATFPEEQGSPEPPSEETSTETPSGYVSPPAEVEASPAEVEKPVESKPDTVTTDPVAGSPKPQETASVVAQQPPTASGGGSPSATSDAVTSQEFSAEDTAVIEQDVADSPEPSKESAQPESSMKSDVAADTPATKASAATPLSEGDPVDDDLGRLFDTGRHTSVDWRSGGSLRGDQGPHTQPVAAARFEEETDDAFLAELRRAMIENEPLGPDSDEPKN